MILGPLWGGALTKRLYLMLGVMAGLEVILAVSWTRGVVLFASFMFSFLEHSFCTARGFWVTDQLPLPTFVTILPQVRS